MLNKFFKTIHNKYYIFFRFIFFLRYLFLIFFISTALFLFLPNFFNYDKKAEIIKKNIFDEYNFKIVEFEKIEFRSFPLPNLELKNVVVLDNSSIKLNVKNLKIFPEFLSIYNDQNFRSKKIILKESNVDLEVSKLNFFFKELLKKKKKLFLNGLKLKVKDKNNLIFKVENIKFINYGYSKNKIFGDIFGKKFKLEVNDSIKNIKFKLIKSGIIVDINFDQVDTTQSLKGILKSRILNTNIKFNFDYDHKVLNIYNSYFRNKNLSFSNNSLIIFNPFLYIESEFDIDEINVKKIKKIDLEKIFQSKDIIKQINSKNKINFRSSKFNRNLIDELNLTVEFTYGTIDYLKKFSISESSFQCKGNINILDEYPLLFFNCSIFTKDKKKLFKKFLIKTKENNEIFKLNFRGNLNILNNKINFKEINLNNKYKASKEDLIFYKENFEDILFDKSLLEIFELKKIKKFIQNIS